MKHKGLIIASAAIAILACAVSRADAAQCGSGPGGFAAWKQQFAEQARAKGIRRCRHPRR